LCAAQWTLGGDIQPICAYFSAVVSFRIFEISFDKWLAMRSKGRRRVSDHVAGATRRALLSLNAPGSAILASASQAADLPYYTSSSSLSLAMRSGMASAFSSSSQRPGESRRAEAR
jgi:hypothetical protein